MTGPGVVIAGGGLAAQRCCETLRARGYEGRVTVVCAEPVRPYDRPPLSKDVLAGAMPGDGAHFRPPEWYAENRIDLLLARRARGLDAGNMELELDDGERLRFDQLLLATGSTPVTLPGSERFDNVHTLRTLADAERLAGALGPGTRLAVIGAGFIGQEAAATARGLGTDVTLIEAADAPLQAVLGDELGLWFARLHSDEGVDVMLSAMVERLEGQSSVEEIVLADGRRIGCDAVLVGIGVRPDVGWLEGSALEPNGSIEVDAAGRTAVPGVFAAGDATVTVGPDGTRLRCEHWEAAAQQGSAAARGMLGHEPRPAPPAAFWSDQYGLRINYVGRPGATDGVLIEGDPQSRDFAAVFTHRGSPRAALLVGRPRELAEKRRLIATAPSETRGSDS